MIFREGHINGCDISSGFYLLKGQRVAVMQIRIINNSRNDLRAPVQAFISGGVDYVHDWTFNKPAGTKTADVFVEPHRVVKRNNDKYLAVGVSLDGMRWFAAAGIWEGVLDIPKGNEAFIYFYFGVGDEKDFNNLPHPKECDPGSLIGNAKSDLEERAAYIFTKLPRFECDDALLTDFYYRSLVHYLTNEWRVDEFIINPYFGTGSVNGGCVCSYLWDFSAGWEIHALYKPDVFKAQIKIFLGLDLTKCFAFLPVSGNPYGPWYPVNQEKIIGLVYFYILLTGDKKFLSETVNDVKVIDLIVAAAKHGINVNEPLKLIDYGTDGEHHLELRRGVPYHGVLPDLNARRYKSFSWAAALCDIAGRTDERASLLSYACDLKKLMRGELWDGEKKWFDFKLNEIKDARYTVQMFKLADSDVLDDDMLDGLLTHLNEEEFLSEYGLHSMSKKDPAYDQIDIDNGGGGNCTIFPTLIAEKLYARGKAREADDILHRILWWGRRLPYWGDSMVANFIDYRKDTPLQCTIGGVTGAQCVIFGLTGLNVDFDGSVSFNPHLPSFARRMRFTGLNIAGKTMDINFETDDYTVTRDGMTTTKRYGERLRINQ